MSKNLIKIFLLFFSDLIFCFYCIRFKFFFNLCDSMKRLSTNFVKYIYLYFFCLQKFLLTLPRKTTCRLQINEKWFLDLWLFFWRCYKIDPWLIHFFCEKNVRLETFIAKSKKKEICLSFYKRSHKISNDNKPGLGNMFGNLLTFHSSTIAYLTVYIVSLLYKTSFKPVKR